MVSALHISRKLLSNYYNFQCILQLKQNTNHSLLGVKTHNICFRNIACTNITTLTKFVKCISCRNSKNSRPTLLIS